MPIACPGTAPDSNSIGCSGHSGAPAGRGGGAPEQAPRPPLAWIDLRTGRPTHSRLRNPRPWVPRGTSDARTARGAERWIDDRSGDEAIPGEAAEATGFARGRTRRAIDHEVAIDEGTQRVAHDLHIGCLPESPGLAESHRRHQHGVEGDHAADRGIQSDWIGGEEQHRHRAGVTAPRAVPLHGDHSVHDEEAGPDKAVEIHEHLTERSIVFIRA